MTGISKNKLKFKNFKFSPEVDRKWVEEKSHIDSKNVRAVSENRTKVRISCPRISFLERPRVARIERHRCLTPLVVTKIGIPFKVYTGFCVYQLILFGFFIQTQKLTAQYSGVKGMTYFKLISSDLK